MNRQDLDLLQQVRGYPALSITLPMHRTGPENRQDSIRLRNLATKAANRLVDELGKREVEPVLSRLERLVASIDPTDTLDGLALFVNRDFARAFHLPFPLKERVAVDDDFLTRDLVFALNRTPRYWVVALSEKPTRLFEGTGATLVEVAGHGFPMVHEGPGGEEPLPTGTGVNTSAYRDERHRQFFRQVDGAIKAALAADPVPLVVVGVERYLAFFRELTQHGDAVLATATGNWDKAPVAELAARVWPKVQEGLAAGRRQVLEELDQAVGERKVGSGLPEVWRRAHEGRGRVLLVEESYHAAGRVDDTGLDLLPAEDASAPGVLDDAVDEVIEEVLAKGGRVVFVEDGRLAGHHRIALILRY